MTSCPGAILVAVTETTYGRQDSGKTPKSSQSLCGNWRMTTKSREALNSETRPWATPTGSRVPHRIPNLTILMDMRHVSICGQNTVTPGTTNRAAWNTALSARTTQFQSDHPTLTMTYSHQSQQRCIWVVRLLNYDICMCQYNLTCNSH